MDIFYTDHAKYQLDKRKVDRTFVEETIRFPDLTKRIDNKCYVIKKLNGKKLKVVYIKERYIKVITLFWI